jgi:hypothetical protein
MNFCLSVVYQYNQVREGVFIMKTVRFVKISFSSFIMLCVKVAASLGITIGIIMLVIALLGGDVYARIGDIYITGYRAGLIDLFLVPLIMMIIGFAFSLVTYLPLTILMKYSNGLEISGEIAKKV